MRCVLRMSSDHSEQFSTTYVFPVADPLAEGDSVCTLNFSVINEVVGSAMEKSAGEVSDAAVSDYLDHRHQIVHNATSLPAGSAADSEISRQKGHESVQKKMSSDESQTIFAKPSVPDSTGKSKIKVGGTHSVPPTVHSQPGNTNVASRHSRSASHGGSSQIGPHRPSALKQHKRYASQGQIVEDINKGLKSHNRVPSKTEFTLPPGHVEREQRASAGSHTWDAHWRGHSRQASRSESIYTLRTTKVSLKSKLLFWKPEVKEDPKLRTVVPNHCVPPDIPHDQHPNGKYPTNHIRTTKYTMISFLPKNLFEQFHRFANLYFISIVLLNWIPVISAFGKEIAMLPVMFVLGVTAIKDLFEDRRRHQSDKRINNSTCRVYKRDQAKYVKVKWKEMRVGDLVHLSCDEMIPADILVLRTNDANGLCYIETSNLDGESNLKQREVIRGFVDKVQQAAFQPHEFTSRIEVGPPTTKIYHFAGSITHPDGTKVPVTKENLLLRDCILKNTDFVEGIVVYAGRETKAMLNNGGPRHKRTGLERLMNTEVVWCVVILAVLCIVGATGYALWLDSFVEPDHVPYIFVKEETLNLLLEAFYSSLTFVIILQVMIPLSLYVTIELTKLMQIYHIQHDPELYDPETKKRVECRAMNISEDLGQIQYVFSDKTGTLTENKMVFQRCSIVGIDYVHPPVLENDQKTFLKMPPSPSVRPNEFLIELLCQQSNQLSVDLVTSKIKQDHQLQKIRDFFMVMAACNTVVVAKYPHHDQMNESGVVSEQVTAVQSSRLSPITEANDSGTLVSRDPSPLLPEYQTNLEISLLPSGNIASNNAPPKPGAARSSKRARFFEVLPTRPLSPISSSNETTPSESPAQRPRFLQIPPLLNRFSKTLQLNQNAPTPSPTPMDAKPIYEAESPDELALVEAAYAYNCKLLKRTPQNVKVYLPGEGVTDYEILHSFPFDSNRKRMSVVLKHPKTEQITLYCKGADSVILSRLKKLRSTDEQRVLDLTQTHINNYAKEGLRTLCMAKRIISEQDYLLWLHKFQEAELDIDNRDTRMAEAYSSMEHDLDLVGAVGIEDKLQDGVPSTIESLRKAGIVVWVLTGDKQETAINIAHSCKLFSSSMDIIKLNARSKDAAERTIGFYLDECSNFNEAVPDSHAGGDSMAFGGNAFENRPRNSIEYPPLISKERGIVVDGRTLTYILDQRAKLLSKFLTLTRHASAVLCCRATPLQKAYIVQSVKDQLGMKTLAIGDGANDVSMIQRADVGIGISGKEGMQAVMASDFAISKFRYLERLLLVHGHWCYDRLARMILYFFYKNAAFVFVIFWFQLLNGWSGSVMIDQMYLMVYNLLFTALPPMAIGIYDQDASADLLISMPKLYRQGRLQKVHQTHSFWLNMLDALYQSIVIFFISYGACSDSDVGLFEFGTTIVISCMFTALVHMAIEAKSWTIIHVFSILASVIVFYVFAFVYNSWCNACLGFENPFGVIQVLISTPVHWLTIVVTVVLAVLPRLVIRCLETTLAPSEVTKVLLMQKQNSRRSNSAFGSWPHDIPASPRIKDTGIFSWLHNLRGNRRTTSTSDDIGISTVAT